MGVKHVAPQLATSLARWSLIMQCFSLKWAISGLGHYCTLCSKAYKQQSDFG